MKRLFHSATAIMVGVATLTTASLLTPAVALEPAANIIVAQADKPSGKGTINSVDAAGRKLNMTHGPIPALKWDGMTMDFGVAPGVDIGALKAGAKVGFTLGRAPDGMYIIDSIKPE